MYLKQKKLHEFCCSLLNVCLSIFFFCSNAVDWIVNLLLVCIVKQTKHV